MSQKIKDQLYSTTLAVSINNLEWNIPSKFSVGASIQTFEVGYNRLNREASKASCKVLLCSVSYPWKQQKLMTQFLSALPNLQVFIFHSNNFYYGLFISSSSRSSWFPWAMRILEISDTKFTGSLSPSII